MGQAIFPKKVNSAKGDWISSCTKDDEAVEVGCWMIIYPNPARANTLMTRTLFFMGWWVINM